MDIKWYNLVITSNQFEIAGENGERVMRGEGIDRGELPRHQRDKLLGHELYPQQERVRH